MKPGLSETDPDLVAIMDKFLYGEIYNRSNLLTVKQRDLIATVSLVTQQSGNLLRDHLSKTLDDTLSAVEVKEAVYQCIPYVGLPRVIDAIGIVNDVLVEYGISLPLESQTTTNENNRFSMGLDAQATIFGEGMRAIAAAGAENMPRSSYHLVTNCFGDYYTRTGLDLATREMLTLAILCNLGTEPQIKSHVKGNATMGHDKGMITELMYLCLPYMGYPRFLNALGYLAEVMPIEQPSQQKGE